MTEPWGYVPSCAAEFPNDNPALHDGVTWVCLRVSGPPRPVTRPRTPSVERAAPAPMGISPAVSPPNAIVSEVVAEPLVAEPVVADTSPEVTSFVALPLLSSTEPVVEPVGEFTVREDRLPESVLSALMQTLDVEVAVDASAPIRSLDFRVVEAPLELDAMESTESDFSERAVAATGAEAPLELDAIGVLESEPSSSVFLFDADGESDAPESHQQTLATETPMPEAAASEVRTVTTDPEPIAPDAFTALVSALVDVALSAGATRAAAMLPDLLERGTLDAGAFSDEIRGGLIAARIVNASAAPTEIFLSEAGAWRHVLRGESGDFSGCGPSTLDEWTTALLKGFGVGQSGKMDVRRELRRRGVAAFGMLLAA